MTTSIPVDPPSTDTPTAIRLAQLSRRWACTRQTINNMIRDKQLHSFKVRNCRLIPLSEVERIERGGDA